MPATAQPSRAGRSAGFFHRSCVSPRALSAASHHGTACDACAGARVRAGLTAAVRRLLRGRKLRARCSRSTTSSRGCRPASTSPTSSCFTSATSGSIPASSSTEAAATARTLRSGPGANSRNSTSRPSSSSVAWSVTIGPRPIGSTPGSCIGRRNRIPLRAGGANPRQDHSPPRGREGRVRAVLRGDHRFDTHRLSVCAPIPIAAISSDSQSVISRESARARIIPGIHSGPD